MRSALIRRLSPSQVLWTGDQRCDFGSPRYVWSDLAHLGCMDIDKAVELGLDPLLTTSELADYLGVKVQAIYDLRCHGGGPVAIHIGRELRYRTREVRGWLDRMEDRNSAQHAAVLEEAGKL